MAYLVYVSFLLTCVCVIGSNARSSLSMTSLKHSPPSRISKVNLVPSIGTSIGSNKRNSIYKNHLPEITETANTLVVGGGLCGMAAAYYALKDKKDSWDGKQAPEKMQYEVLLCDAKNRMGGNINTQQNENFLWEAGPNSFQPTPTILQFAHDLGIYDELVYADGNLPRYVVQPDKVDKEKYNLVPVPLSVYEFLTTPLLTISSKLRVLCGLLGWIDPNPNDPNPGNLRDGKSTEESIREFMQRHFGNELYEKLVDPFISGVYAGSGDKLSMSAAFPKIYAYDENHTFSRSILENVLLPGEKVKGKPHLDPKLKSNPDATLLKLKPPPDGALANFRNGMNTFIQGVERALSAPDSRLGHNLNPAPVGGVRTNHKLIKLHYDRYYKKYIAHFSKTLSGLDSGIGCESENADTWEDVYIAANNVVIASPSFETSKILKHSTMEVKDMDMIVPLVPSPSSASDTGSAGRDTLDLLNALPYCPVAAVICAYPKSSLRNVKGQPGGIDDFKAFGMLVPRNVVSKINGNSSFSLLGSIWSSSLFPEGRAPKDYIVLVNFVGGSHNPQLVLGSPEKAAPSEEELVNIVHRDLGEILLHNGIELDSETSKPIVLAVKKWEKGIPQYVKGYNKDILQIQETISSINENTGPSNKLLLTGNYVGGVSINDCIAHGKHISSLL